MKAAIYVRISKDPEGRQAGVARQEKECRALVEQRGWDLVEVYRENDTSAFRGKRPVWRRLLEALEDGEVEVVVGWSSDRLYRKVRDQLDLLERAGRIVTVKDGEVDPTTAEGKMRMGILANVSAFESDRKSERHVAKHKQLAEAGAWPGGRVPYGYRRDGATLKIVPEEAKALREAAAVILDGATLRTAADRLAMDRRVAKRLLMRPTIAGRRMLHGEELKASWPPILDVRTWRRVRAILDDPARGPRGPRPRYLLTGLTFCSSCGGALIGHPQRGVRSYACIRTGPGHVQVRSKAATLEALILDMASQRTVATTTVLDPSEHRDVHDRLDAIDDQLSAWAATAAAAGLSVQEIKAGREPLLAERAALEEQLADRSIVTFTDRQGKRRADIDATAESRARTAMRKMDPRSALETKVDRIVLHPAGRNRYLALEDRVEVIWRS